MTAVSSTGPMTIRERCRYRPSWWIILREHLDEFGTAADGRLFRTVTGGMIYDHTATWAAAPDACPDTGSGRLAYGGPAPTICGTGQCHCG